MIRAGESFCLRLAHVEKCLALLEVLPNLDGQSLFLGLRHDPFAIGLAHAATVATVKAKRKAGTRQSKQGEATPASGAAALIGRPGPLALCGLAFARRSARPHVHHVHVDNCYNTSGVNTMCSNRNRIKGRPGVEALEGRELLANIGSGMAGALSLAPRGSSGVPAFVRSFSPSSGPNAASSSSRAFQQAQVYHVTLMAENNSGVTGQATLIRRGNILRVSLVVSGLEPNQLHAAHLHGFAGQPQDKPSMMPPPEAAAADPTPNGLGPSITSESEGTPFVGPVIKTLSRGIRANANGVGRLNTAVNLGHDAYAVGILPLEFRALEVHGLTVNGTYQPSVPVAGGMPVAANA
jgi:hypothetical protein